jgi:hypothetical protein
MPRRARSAWTSGGEPRRGRCRRAGLPAHAAPGPGPGPSRHGQPAGGFVPPRHERPDPGAPRGAGNTEGLPLRAGQPKRSAGNVGNSGRLPGRSPFRSWGRRGMCGSSLRLHQGGPTGSGLRDWSNRKANPVEDAIATAATMVMARLRHD